jgi:hypothetical protein
VATLRTLDNTIATTEHCGYPPIKSGLNINLIATRVLSNLDRICIFLCFEGQPRGRSITPLHLKSPSGRRLFLETLSILMIKLVSFFNDFLWILLMITISLNNWC